MLEFLNQIDVQLMYLFNVTLRNPVFDWYMPLFHKGDNWRIPLVILWLGLMIFGGNKGRWAGLAGLLMVGMTDLLSSQIIKPLVGRIRPCNVLGNLYLFKDGAWMFTPEVVTEVYKSSKSFTSSHAANTFGQAIWWSILYPRTRWFWYILGFSIGYSRIYDGVHYPFDVLGGWVVGFLCFYILYSVCKRWGPRSLKNALTGELKEEPSLPFKKNR